jgi:predicted DNA-binding ribbon-helix-helix protein
VPSDLIHTPSCGFQTARKYSVTIAGHETSIRLEPVYWKRLISSAQQRAIPVNALIARIDAARIANHPSPNLASAIRQWILAETDSQLVAKLGERGAPN